MDKNLPSDSDMSTDSLEIDVKEGSKKESLQTILVPFYDKDVLIKVPKESMKSSKSNDLVKPVKGKVHSESKPQASYLFNNVKYKSKQTITYLEAFRKKCAHPQPATKKQESDICSLYPEYGDTERSSIEEIVTNNVTEFYDTEAYNDIFYEKLLNKQLSNSSSTDKYGDNDGSPDKLDCSTEHLKSLSEVPRQQRRKFNFQPVPSLKLGGLGPDTDNIKPRLDRARSLQRYSEKVRMENKVKIYKTSLQVDAEKRIEDNKKEQEKILKMESLHISEKHNTDNQKASYLLNKSISKTVKIYNKSKSADPNKSKERELKSANPRGNSSDRSHKREVKPNALVKSSRKEKKTEEKIQINKTVKSNKHVSKTVAINTDTAESPVQISFMVNVGGVRPSSALRSLEEKHRIYQERVKAYTSEFRK